jgi:hypothetical protein
MLDKSEISDIDSIQACNGSAELFSSQPLQTQAH